jgi:hypothetical protein
MTTHHCLIGFDEGPGTIFKVDVIEYLGAFWLVPEWLESPELKERRPTRIISLMTLPHQDIPNGQYPRFLVNVPVSKAVFEGRIPPERAKGYIVIDRPDIRLPFGDGLN